VVVSGMSGAGGYDPRLFAGFPRKKCKIFPLREVYTFRSGTILAYRDGWWRSEAIDLAGGKRVDFFVVR